MLSKQELLALLDKLMRPEEYDLTQEQGDQVLRDFCSGCPDPAKARWLVVECLEPMTDEQLVERAMDDS